MLPGLRRLPGRADCPEGEDAAAVVPPKAAASRRTMPIWKAYTDALPSRTVEEKLEKGWLRKEVELSQKRYAKMPQWKKDLYAAQFDHARELAESGRYAFQ